MAKKGSSNKRNLWDNPFGGFFDFNRDGKEDLGELWIAYNLFNKSNEKNSSHRKGSAFSPGFGWNDDTVDVSWRDYCEDGSEFDIDPEDYQSEF